MSGSKQGTESVSKKLPQVFQAFIRECREEVEPALLRFDISGPEVIAHPPECAVRYSGDRICLTIDYEYGSQPWATLEVSLQSGWRQFSLHRLMKSMCPELAREDVGKGKSEDVARLQTLRVISQFIPKIASVFEGDLSLLGVSQQSTR